MDNKKVFCVISHTHWDREWYAPLEVFRNRLVDLFDHLLTILDENPEYVFHMDSQTVVLEDYLAVRPEKKAILKKHIADRRIMVGPWYLQNDFYLTSGEATVRNLLAGAALCREFGGKGGIGYAPDQFGNISQLPQILDNFGIKNFVFGRGFSSYFRDAAGNVCRKTLPTEFTWQGADGTRALAIHMRHWYNNAQRFSADIDKAYKYAKQIAAGFDNEYTLTPYILFMNGVDHLEPQADLLQVIDGVQKKLDPNEAFLQYNFDDYVADVQKYIDDHDVELMVHKGELRNGNDFEILKGTLSSRHYLKIANNEAQIMLENRLEPLYSMMEQQGMRGVYSYDHFEYTWKNLLRNHPHDSICGCSHDGVHAHMENRYSEIMEYGEDLMQRGMRSAAEHTAAIRSASPDDYVLTVANTLSKPVNGAVRTTIRFLKDENIDNFEVFDNEGRPVDCAVLSARDWVYSVTSPINLPGELDVREYEIYLSVGEVQPYSFKSFLFKKAAGTAKLTSLKQSDAPVLENEYLRVSVAKDGKVQLCEKKTGRLLEDCIALEDLADAGESYVFMKGGDRPVLSSAVTPEIEITEYNDYVKTVRLVFTMNLPETYLHAENKRSEKTVVSTVTLELSLKKDEPFLHVGYTIDNHSKCHRLRVLVRADLSSEVSTADIPFDIVTHGAEAHYIDTQSRVLPNTSFAALTADNRGLAVFTKGAHEYEHQNGNELAFTILRATGHISGDPVTGWQVPGNQCLRTFSGEMALFPFAGDVISADVPNMSLRFRAPLLAAWDACDIRKFSGGRPCVQDSELSEFFYLPDQWPDAAMPDNRSAVQVEGRGVTVTAFKKSEDQSGLILRLCNYSDSQSDAKVTATGKIYKTTMAEIRREFIGFNEVELTMGPKKIVTLFLSK